MNHPSSTPKTEAAASAPAPVPSPFPHVAGPVALGYCLLNWLIPGAGYIAVKDYRRGIALFALINGVFLTGLFYDGYVYVPPLTPRDPNFNIVALLSFIVQLANAGATFLVLSAGEAGGLLGRLFDRPAGSPFSDLGAFHFLVSGGLNYFATTRLFDFLTGYAEKQELRERAAEEARKQKKAKKQTGQAASPAEEAP